MENNNDNNIQDQNPNETLDTEKPIISSKEESEPTPIFEQPPKDFSLPDKEITAIFRKRDRDVQYEHRQVERQQDKEQQLQEQQKLNTTIKTLRAENKKISARNKELVHKNRVKAAILAFISAISIGSVSLNVKNYAPKLIKSVSDRIEANNFFNDLDSTYNTVKNNTTYTNNEDENGNQIYYYNIENIAKEASAMAVNLGTNGFDYMAYDVLKNMGANAFNKENNFNKFFISYCRYSGKDPISFEDYTNQDIKKWQSTVRSTASTESIFIVDGHIATYSKGGKTK